MRRKPAAPTVAIDMALDATTQNALAGALIGHNRTLRAT